MFIILTHFIIGQARAEEEPEDIITDDCFFKKSNVDAGVCPAVSNILFTFYSLTFYYTYCSIIGLFMSFDTIFWDDFLESFFELE